MLVAGVDRAAEAEAAGELGRFVGKNIAVHVLGDDHVEAHRVAQEERRHGVDDDLFELNLGKALRDLAHFAQIQPVGEPKHVRLVYADDSPAAYVSQMSAGLYLKKCARSRKAFPRFSSKR